MTRKKNYIIIFSSIFLLIAFGFVWSFIVTFNIRKDAEHALSKEQQVTVSNLVLTETKDTKKYWELYSKKGYYEGSREVAKLEDIIGNFYDEEGTVVLSFKASSGSYFEGEKKIVLEGDAMAVSKDGSSIIADKVVFKGKDDDIVASGNVRINKNNQLLTKSDRAVFNSELTYFRIEGKSESKVFEDEGTDK